MQITVGHLARRYDLFGQKVYVHKYKESAYGAFEQLNNGSVFFMENCKVAFMGKKVVGFITHRGIPYPWYKELFYKVVAFVLLNR